MRHERKLSQRLRAIILATPLIGVPACTSSGLGICFPPDASAVFSLATVGDGGRVDGAPCDDPFSTCSSVDGGFDCMDACSWLVMQKTQSNGSIIQGCNLLTLPDAGPGVDCNWITECPSGRRPASLRASPIVPKGNPVGAHFATAARLEAAAIPAFQILAGELAAHRAPRQLIRAANCSMVDELCHARAMGAIARRYGATPIQPELGTHPKGRSIEAIAAENAIEGCARETYGALLALWQSRNAMDPVVAATMASIAEDEARHAELAWEVAAWAESKLSPAARSRTVAARDQALAELNVAVVSPPSSLVAVAGLPPIEINANLIEALVEQVCC
jgi:hypothetical protein